MSSGPPGARDHWPMHARQWALVGPPLRPCPDDVERVAAEIAAWSAAQQRPPRALLLGVTPELVTMAWPPGTVLTAIDRSAAMVAAIFPAGTGATAQVGEWLALPLPERSIDVVLGDGCLSCLSFPDGYRALAAELRRILADDGRLVLRLFAAPPAGETLAEVADDLSAGRIASLHALKWRIAMAIQPDHRNVAVADIWRAFETLITDRAALAARTGWSAETIGTIDVYRDSDVVYSFPTAAEVAAALGDHFVAAASHTPGYPMGERCVTVVWLPSPRAPR